MARSPVGGASSSVNNARMDERVTLGDVMRAPSTNTPEVVVLDSTHDEKAHEDALNPREDLWLSSADGRYNSPIIPLHVGAFPNAQTFNIHKDILLRTEYFKKALCGGFKEADSQRVDLPEEDPAIFHFVVAFLYEARYVPIKPMASALDPKGKGLAMDDEGVTSDSDSSVAGDDAASDSSSARSRRRRARRRRREDRQWELARQKHPGAHRIGCGCSQCLAGGGPPCWHCLAPRFPPPPPLPPAGPSIVMVNPGRRVRTNRPHDPRDRPVPSPSVPQGRNASSGDRIQGEDLRSWLLTYNLNLDVYICANKFLLDDFKLAVSRSCIDMLESAGADAAQPEVLQLCSKLYEGLPESDPLLGMVFARVGFLQPLLWRQAPQETSEFLLGHPEISALILKETANRREMDHGVYQLPPMERPHLPPPLDSPYARPGAPLHRARR